MLTKLPQVEDKEQEPAARILVARPVKRYEPEFLQRFCFLFILSTRLLTCFSVHHSATQSVQVPIPTLGKELPVRVGVPATGRGLPQHLHRSNRTLLRIWQHLGFFAYGLVDVSLCVQSLKPCKEPKAVGVLCSLTAILCMPQSRWFELYMSHDTTSKFAFILTFVDLKSICWWFWTILLINSTLLVKIYSKYWFRVQNILWPTPPQWTHTVVRPSPSAPSLESRLRRYPAPHIRIPKTWSRPSRISFLIWTINWWF